MKPFLEPLERNSCVTSQNNFPLIQGKKVTTATYCLHQSLSELSLFFSRILIGSWKNHLFTFRSTQSNQVFLCKFYKRVYLNRMVVPFFSLTGRTEVFLYFSFFVAGTILQGYSTPALYFNIQIQIL